MDGWGPGTKVDREGTCKYADRIKKKKKSRKNSLIWWDVVGWTCMGFSTSTSLLPQFFCLHRKRRQENLGCLQAALVSYWLGFTFMLSCSAGAVGPVYCCGLWRLFSLHSPPSELPLRDDLQAWQKDAQLCSIPRGAQMQLESSREEISSASVITWKEASLMGGSESTLIKESERAAGAKILAGIVPEMKGNDPPDEPWSTFPLLLHIYGKTLTCFVERLSSSNPQFRITEQGRKHTSKINTSILLCPETFRLSSCLCYHAVESSSEMIFPHQEAQILIIIFFFKVCSFGFLSWTTRA